MSSLIKCKAYEVSKNKNDIPTLNGSRVSQLLKDAQKLLNIPKHQRLNDRNEDLRRLLDEAEILLSTEQNNLLSFALQRDCAYMKCRLEGELANWDRVIESAENALHFIELISFHESNDSKDDDVSKEMLRRNEFTKASAIGYVGYSFMKQKNTHLPFGASKNLASFLME